MLDPVTTPVVDACTLNNVMNAAQIALLVVLVRWLQREPREPQRRD